MHDPLLCDRGRGRGKPEEGRCLDESIGAAPVTSRVTLSTARRVRRILGARSVAAPAHNVLQTVLLDERDQLPAAPGPFLSRLRRAGCPGRELLQRLRPAPGRA